MIKCAALIYGPDHHHLDHLAPLSVILDIPLLVTEEEIAAQAKKYYPTIQVEVFDYLSMPHLLISHYDVIFYSFPRDLFDEVFFVHQKLMGKKVHTIWCPHGNSDKGYATFHMEALKKEEAALVYGKQMIEFLKAKHVFNQLKGHVNTGNYRREFYLAHQEFYDKIAEREILRHLPAHGEKILYAPTWQDYEHSTSFFEATPHLIKALPDNYTLIVKLHPNFTTSPDIEVEKILDLCRDHPRVLVLTDFPPIYPLLNLVDLYIGDMSSIGYDFLSFNRPMFFLNQNNRDKQSDLGLYIYRCGLEITPSDYANIFEIINEYFQFELRDFSALRKDVNAYAFGHPKPLDLLRKEIEHLYTQFDKDLNFF